LAAEPSSSRCPPLQADAGLAPTTVQQVVDEIDKGDIGKPVALRDEVDTVSFLLTKVSGAPSAERPKTQTPSGDRTVR
jgi:hypothetical protein